MKELSIILVHPCEVIRESITLLLKKHGYHVGHAFDSCKSFLAEIDNLKADIILAHYSEYEKECSLVDIKSKTGANIALLASSDSYHKDNYEDIIEMVTSGITGFLDMNEAPVVFISEIDNIASGGIVISSHFIHDLHKKVDLPNEEKSTEHLSERENAILDLVVKGCTNREIGQDLFISEHTVKAHLSSIMTKLNIKNRQQAVAYIMQKRMKNSTGQQPV